MDSTIPTHRTSFAELVSVVDALVKNIRSLAKISNKLRSQFSIDITLVALSIRTGYLADALPIKETSIYPLILHELQAKIPIFQNVSVLRELSTDQVFFLNLPLFRDTLSSAREFVSGIGPWFVRLDDPPSLLSGPPENILRALAEIEQALFHPHQVGSASWSNDSGAARAGLDVLVPVAGVLIGYPVVYVPASADQTTFLSGEPLLQFSCLLHSDIDSAIPHGHVLMSFTVPCRLTSTIPQLSPERIETGLRTLYEARLKESGCNLSFTIRYDTKIFDRVAL